MKRIVLPLLSFILVITLLLASFGSAKAAVGDDPVVTPVSGDVEFTTEVIPIVSLPGVTELAGGMLAPVGFPAGEAQFGGDGVLVTGMDTGKATACFSLSSTAIAEGWGGKVGMWNGSKWIQLPTTITTPVDSPNSLGCATITGNGTYAFIKYVVDPELLPTSKPVCSFSIGWLLSFYGSDPNAYVGIVTPNTYPPSGTPFSWVVDSATPPGLLMGPISGSNVIGSDDIFDLFFTNKIGPYYDTNGGITPEFNMRVDFADCYALMHFGGTN